MIKLIVLLGMLTLLVAFTVLSTMIVGPFGGIIAGVISVIVYVPILSSLGG